MPRPQGFPGVLWISRTFASAQTWAMWSGEVSPVVAVQRRWPNADGPTPDRPCARPPCRSANAVCIVDGHPGTRCTRRPVILARASSHRARWSRRATGHSDASAGRRRWQGIGHRVGASAVYSVPSRPGTPQGVRRAGGADVPALFGRQRVAVASDLDGLVVPIGDGHVVYRHLTRE